MKHLVKFEKVLFSWFILIVTCLFFRFNLYLVHASIRRDPWLWIHLPLSFTYVTCGWFHMYIWYAKMSQAYFISCFYELPIIWDIFVSILLPDWFPDWFDFYEVSGIENLYIEDHPDKELKKRT